MPNDNNQDPWLDHTAKTSYRNEEPEFWEGIEDFKSAAVFLDSIEEQVKTMIENQDAAGVASAVAVANNYVRRIWFRSNIIDSIAGDEDPEDSEEEIAAAQAASKEFQNTEQRLEQLHQTREQALKDWPPENTDAKYQHCTTTALTANIAVAQHHIQQANDESLPPNRRMAHVISAWANKSNIAKLYRYSRAEEDLFQQAHETYLDLLYAAQGLTEHTTVRISKGIKAIEMEQQVAELRWMMEQQTEETPGAMYSFEENQDGPWPMVYVYQGVLYSKLVNEPYDHPVDREIAVEHAVDMLKKLEDIYIEEDEDQDEESAEAQYEKTRGNIVREAALAMQLAECLLHSADPKSVRRMLEEVWWQTADADRVQSVTKALTKDMDMVAVHLTGGGRNRPLHQMLREIETAHQNGADPGTLATMRWERDISWGRSTPHHLKNQAPKASWNMVRAALHTLYDIATLTQAPAKALVEALGWEYDNPQVREEMASLQSYYDSYTLD